MESEDFKEWLEKNYHEVMALTIAENEEISDHLEYFEWLLPFEMKWGVYLKYFDENHIQISIDAVYSFTENYFTCRINNWDQIGEFKTRLEAQQEAVKKAFESISK